MSDEAPDPKENIQIEVHAESQLGEPAQLVDPESSSLDQESPLFIGLSRMLAGGALEGRELLVSRLRAWEQANPQDPQILDAAADESELDRDRYALIGALLDGLEAAGQGASVLGWVGNSVSRLVLGPIRAVGNSLPMRPAKRGFEALVARGEKQRDQWVQQGRAAELRTRQMTREVVTGTVDEAVSYFSSYEEIQVLIRGQIELLATDIPTSPELDNLVKVLASNYLAYLQEHPEMLDGLVQSQADQYLDHLHDHPEQVQDLVAGQSVGFASTIRDEIRERLINVDIVLEKLVRGTLKKPSRNQLPPPPAEVQARAETGIVPGDFPRLEEQEVFE